MKACKDCESFLKGDVFRRGSDVHLPTWGGTCHLGPPSEGRFPFVNAEDWCSKFTKKEEIT